MEVEKTMRALFLAVCVVFMMSSCAKTVQNVNADVDVTKFHDETGMFAYNNIPWNSTESEVSKRLGILLGEPMIPIVDDGSDYVNYFIYNYATLNNIGTRMTVQFRDGKFWSLTFDTLTSADDAEQVESTYQSLVEQLTAAYGEPSRELQNEQIKSCAWIRTSDTSNETRLNLAMFYTNGIPKSVGIGVASLPEWATPDGTN